MSRVALDTSAAIPFLLVRHEAHEAVMDRVASLSVSMTGHSLIETYSVLTRLPGDARLLPGDASQLLEANFAPPVLIDEHAVAGVPQVLAEHGIAGGAVYDALVALAVKGTDVTLLTRDLRAVATYSVLDILFELV